MLGATSNLRELLYQCFTTFYTAAYAKRGSSVLFKVQNSSNGREEVTLFFSSGIVLLPSLSIVPYPRDSIILSHSFFIPSFQSENKFFTRIASDELEKGAWSLL